MIRDSRGGYNRKTVNENFFKIWSPKMAYVLGFMFADGSLLDTNKSSRTYYLHFSNNDSSLLNDIRIALGSEHNIYTRQPRITNYKRGKYISKLSYVLRIGNKVMYHDLLNLGIKHRKSNDMKMPDVPTKYFAFFLRGYFDGDGCVGWYTSTRRHTPSLRLVFTSGSTDFLDVLSITIEKLLTIKAVRCYQSQGAHNLVYRGRNAAIILSYLYRNLDLAPFLGRKYDKYTNFMHNLVGPKVKKALGLNYALARSTTVSTRRLA